MNPLDWLKAAYAAVGTPYPRASLIVVMIFGAVIFGVIWKIGEAQVAKGAAVQPSPATAPSTGPASTNGAQSPANSGSNNSTTYGTDSAPKGKTPK
jgi:hypothetical protein